jgi:hypothetical protein
MKIPGFVSNAESMPVLAINSELPCAEAMEVTVQRIARRRPVLIPGVFMIVGE